MLLEEIKGLATQAVVPGFAQMLMQERRRCERYNHYFCLVTVSAEKVGATELMKRARRALRSSDVLGFVSPNGSAAALHAGQGPGGASAEPPGTPIVGIILPETDRRGGQTAVDRIGGNLTDVENVTIRMAVYPEDSTDVADLLALTAS